VLQGNSAGQGSGAYVSFLANCLVKDNVGAIFGSSAFNCTLVENSGSPAAVEAGSGVICNCIIYSNRNANWSGSASTFISCCTTPSPGPGNITNSPMFVNEAAGDYHLHFGSPCIDTGTDLSSFITNDIAGTPRPLDGRGAGVPAFDIGAYEFNLLATVGTNWLLDYGLNPNDPLVFASHPNGVPFTVLQAWIADANPTNVASFLEAAAISNVPPVTVYFQSSSSRLYSLVWSTNPQGGWAPVAGQGYLAGTGGLMSLADPNTVAQQRFYRVSVSVP